jgi:hypothetical protein
MPVGKDPFVDGRVIVHSPHWAFTATSSTRNLATSFLLETVLNGRKVTESDRLIDTI